MKSISGKDFAKILEKNGWTLMRVKGSHHIYVKKEALLEFRFRYTATLR